MFKILIDTCVWLDLAKDHHQLALLSALEELVNQKKVELIVPRTVVTEFDRNKARIIKESCQSISGNFKKVKEIVNKFGDPKKRKKLLAQLNDLDYKVPLLGESAVEAVKRIEKLLKKAIIIEPTNEIKLRAAQRAIDKKAPFHRQRNGIEDAIIIETYAECWRVLKTKERSMFISHNIKDFSAIAGNEKLPHPDLANFFSKIKSLYFIKLSDALKRIDPSVVTELMEYQEWTEEPRGITEIAEAVGEHLDKVWYNRHMYLRHKVERGLEKIIPDGTVVDWKKTRNVTHQGIWDRALKAADKLEKTYGKSELGPWDDFEWGMINGKLSALRWVLGDDWDFLDT